MKFLLDTNIFIAAKNATPFDVWPTFWLRFADIMRSGSLATAEAVRDEILRGRDDLVEWFKCNVPRQSVIEIDDDIMAQLVRVAEWAIASGQYERAAKDEFLAVADSQLVATAAAKGYTLVTHEKSNPNAKRRILLPEACRAMNVEYCDFNDMLRLLKEKI